MSWLQNVCFLFLLFIISFVTHLCEASHRNNLVVSSPILGYYAWTEENIGGALRVMKHLLLTVSTTWNLMVVKPHKRSFFKCLLLSVTKELLSSIRMTHTHPHNSLPQIHANYNTDTSASPLASQCCENHKCSTLFTQTVLNRLITKQLIIMGKRKNIAEHFKRLLL